MNTVTDHDILELQDIDPKPANLPAVQNAGPAAMMLQAMQQGASLDQVERLMELQERWERREAEKAFNAAFAAFRGEDMHVAKDKERTSGPLQGQKYATLHSFVKATRAALSRHGFGVRWSVTRDEADWIEVTCILKHALGHSETVSMGGPPDAGPARNILQARHSTVSYLERYTLKAICGVTEGDEDDDGEGGAPDKDGGADGSQPDAALQAGRDAAMLGMDALTAWWGKLAPKDRTRLTKEFGNLRKAAGRG